MSAAALVAPGRANGLVDVLRHRFLLRLIVRQEMRVRYRSSVLGLLWTYIKPAVQFGVYFFALGVFLKVNEAVGDFEIYLFSGLVLINFFGEAFGNAARSIVRNAALVNKIYLPRELFPIATTYVAAIHLLPQVVILFLAALLSGWQFSIGAVLCAFLAFAIVAVLVTGLGLFVAALNVFFRDVENFVDLLLLAVVWGSPVLYPWSFVRDKIGEGWGLELYLANPMTIAAQLFQRAFWFPGATSRPDAPAVRELVPHLAYRGLGALAISALVLLMGQLVFKRLQGRFAQEL